MVLTVIIPQAPPINEMAELLTTGTLYAIGSDFAENANDDILLKMTNAGNSVTTIISVKTGLVYPSLPGNAVQLPNGSEVCLKQGNSL